MISIVLISEQKANNLIYINIKTFIDKMKKNVILHNRKTLKNIKIKLLNKHYKSHYIQKWKNDNFEYKWEKLNIESNIKRNLIDNVKAFKRRQLQPDRALLFIHIFTIFIEKRVLNSIENENYNHEQLTKKEFDNELNLNDELYDNEKN